MGLLCTHLEGVGFHIKNDEFINAGNNNDLKLVEKEILMGHECTSISTSENGVTVTVSLAKQGKQISRDLFCKYLVATDGAGSTVRELMGIRMSGERDLQKLISVHFTTQDMGKYLMNERPGMLFFIFNTEAIGVLVAHDLKQGEFVLQVLSSS